MTLDLTHPAEQIATLVAGVTDDQLDAPTPCPEMTVGTLLAHLAALAQAFTDAAAKVSGPTTEHSTDRGRARAARRLADGDPGPAGRRWSRPGSSRRPGRARPPPVA